MNQPVLVGQDHPTRPRAWLWADQADLDRGERNGPAYTTTGAGVPSTTAPLQTFYKFGVWYTPTPRVQPGCAVCAHLRTITRCAAYPNGIPWPILSGEVAHFDPRPDDQDIQFAWADHVPEHMRTVV